MRLDVSLIEKRSSSISATYDYVVIGAGPAGCALAARLADACPCSSIALLEAGPAKAPIFSDVPFGLALLVPFRSRYNYGYHTVPQAGLDGRRGYQPRGRGLGGSSLINAMIYTRGHAGDYDDWAAEGCSGWSYADLLPYFRRSEGNARGADTWHGSDGPLKVEDLASPHPFSLDFIAAAEQAGFEPNADFNGATQEGVGLYQVYTEQGRRCNAARAYLSVPRSNLHVVAGCHVERIVFDGGRATGVEVSRGGGRERIGARAEVILCAGAFGSPQLLMCSGIGPANHLREHGIEVNVDRPSVGENLQDHIDYTINLAVSDRSLFSSANFLPRFLGGYPPLAPRRGSGLRQQCLRSGRLRENRSVTGAPRCAAAFPLRHRRPAQPAAASESRHVGACVRVASDFAGNRTPGACGFKTRAADRSADSSIPPKT